MPRSRTSKNGDKKVDNDGSKMTKFVDEDFNDKGDNAAMVSHNKEEEGEGSGRGARDAKLAEEMSTKDFRTQEIRTPNCHVH